MKWLQQLLGKSLDSTEELTVQTGLNVALKACGVVSISAFLGLMTIVHRNLSPPLFITLTLMALAFLPVAAFVYGFIFALHRDPDLLRSEKYLIARACVPKRSLEEAGERARSISDTQTASTLEAIDLKETARPRTAAKRSVRQ